MRLASLNIEKYGNDKMYQLGEKLAEGVDNVLASFKSYEPAGNGTLAAKQAGGPGRVTEWVNKHHIESSKIIDDKIKNVEGSLAKGTGEVSNSGENLSRIEYLRNKYGRFTPQELNYRINLRGTVAQEVEILHKLGIYKREMGSAVTRIFDKTTGKYYFGINNTSGKIPEELHPLIEQRIINMPKNIKEGYTFTYEEGSHAEVYLLNQALLASPQASVSNFTTHIVRSGKELKPAAMMMPTCPHCNFITEGFEFSSEVKKIEKSN